MRRGARGLVASQASRLTPHAPSRSGSDPDRVEAAVDDEHLGRDGAAGGTEQEQGGVGHFRCVDGATKRRAIAIRLQDGRESRDARRRERANRPGRDRVDANVLRAEVGGQIAHGRLERRLGDAHDVVVGEHALAAEIRERHDAAAAARCHERRRATRERHERIRADVERHGEAPARGLDERLRQILPLGERRAVHEKIQPAAVAGHGLEHRVDLAVVADVAGQHGDALERRRQLAHVLLEPFAGVGEHDVRALSRGRLGDGPRDRPLVGDTDDQAGLAGERCWGRICHDKRDGRRLPIATGAAAAMPMMPAAVPLAAVAAVTAGLVAIAIRPAAALLAVVLLTEALAAARAGLAHRELRNRPWRGGLTVAWQGGAYQGAMALPGNLVRLFVAWRLRAGNVITRRLRGGVHPGVRARLRVRVGGFPVAVRARHELSRGVREDLIVQLTRGLPRRLAAWGLPVLVGVLGFAGRAPGLSNVFPDDGDNGVIRETAFARTIVVHDIAKSQQALLHYVLPTSFIPIRTYLDPGGSPPPLGAARSGLGRCRRPGPLRAICGEHRIADALQQVRVDPFAAGRARSAGRLSLANSGAPRQAGRSTRRRRPRQGRGRRAAPPT